MKKILIVLFSIFLLTYCEFKGPETKAESQVYSLERLGHSAFVNYSYHTVGGMKYLIHSSYGTAIFVTNLTKDKLEVEKLKLEIKKLKDGK